MRTVDVGIPRESIIKAVDDIYTALTLSDVPTIIEAMWSLASCSLNAIPDPNSALSVADMRQALYENWQLLDGELAKLEETRREDAQAM